MKILIIEDDSSLREIIERGLRGEGYVVESASNFAEADNKIAGYSYDCILLDIMLPDGNGLRLLEHIKALKKSDHVIIISARDSLDDKVTGLDLGADDYLAKPFYMAELSARIKSVLRRSGGNGGNKIEVGNVSLDLNSRCVEVDGNALALLKKEFDILLYFMQRSNHIVDKAQLAEAVALSVKPQTVLGLTRADWNGVFWAGVLLLVAMVCLYAAVKKEKREEDYCFE